MDLRTGMCVEGEGGGWGTNQMEKILFMVFL